MGAVQVKGRYGTLECSDNIVNNFSGKPIGDNSYINGFFVVSKNVVDLIDGDETSGRNKL